MNGHQKITVSRTYLATLQRNERELAALYNQGLMDTDLFQDIDWDEV